MCVHVLHMVYMLTETGARAYFMHMILHDWPDEKCRTILMHVQAAMKPGFSKLLINEAVLPDVDCPSFFASSDINMMAILAGIERSRQQWLDLLESVGFLKVKFWSTPGFAGDESIIEVEV
jgi:O-methyltransferase domain